MSRNLYNFNLITCQAAQGTSIKADRFLKLKSFFSVVIRLKLFTLKIVFWNENFIKFTVNRYFFPFNL